MKKIISLILCVALCFALGTAVFAEPTTTPSTTPGTTKPADKGLADVPADYRAYDEIMYVNGEGWMIGFRDGTFRPAAFMTRAMLANVIYRMQGGDASKLDDVTFTDASDIHADYMDGVKYCAANKLMIGFEDNTFRPNDTLTRAQFVTVLYRAQQGSVNSAAAAGMFADADSIADAYVDAVCWAVERGLLLGYSDNTFRPNEPLTRESFCVILYRLYVEPVTSPITTPDTTPNTTPDTTPATTPATTPSTTTVTDPVTTPVG